VGLLHVRPRRQRIHLPARDAGNCDGNPPVIILATATAALVVVVVVVVVALVVFVGF